jgi:Domain of unknown function (DUF4132)
MQTKEEIIVEKQKEFLNFIERHYKEQFKIWSSEIEGITNFFLEKGDFPKLSQNGSRSIEFLSNILYRYDIKWTKDDVPIKKLIVPYTQHWDSVIWIIRSFIAFKLVSYQGVSQDEFDDYFSFFKQQGFSEDEILEGILSNGGWAVFFEYVRESEVRKLSVSGKYILELLKKERTGFLSIFKGSKISEILNNVALEEHGSWSFKRDIFEFLLEYYPTALEGLYEKYMTMPYDNYYGKRLEMQNILVALRKDAIKFEKTVLNLLPNYSVEFEQKLSIYLTIDKTLPNKYEDEIESLVQEFYTKNYHDRYIHLGQKGELVSIVIAKYLLNKNEKTAIPKIAAFTSYADSYSPDFPKFLSEYFGEKCLPFLADAIRKIPKNVGQNFHPQVFELFKKYDFTPIIDKIWDYAINHATKATRELATQALASVGDKVFDQAHELLSAKNADGRITGALVLSKLNTEQANQALKEVIDTEKNDDTRDVIIDALYEQIYSKQLSIDEIKQIIVKAEKRGKLSKFSEKWLREEDLPTVYWADGSKMTQTEVRFIFYRMPRGNGLNSDVEVRQVINQIDKEKSGAFAKKLVQAFSDSGSNSKFKYYLTTGGQLGGNEILHTLKSIFKYNMDEKRYKMAEYAVDALSMVGTNKALRNVEVISRKYANKRPTVSNRAFEALNAAATELNITTDELADRIIPDFDFEGLFKTFEVDGDEYRAFINSDFTLCYFDEDNKLRKSPPKNTSSDLKKEFKEIEKEVRDVVKSQSGRLEKYMIDERRWSVEQWQGFFLQNPIMFVYAMKLLWTVFDENNQVKTVFYCAEDTTLYNIEDEEIEISETDSIAIFHPVYLDTEQVKAWQEKVYQLDLTTIFPQLQRKVFKVSEEEKDQNYTRIFMNANVPKGGDYVSSTIEKYGWLKSTGDGGRLELTKKYKHTEIKAYAEIEGVYAWYQGGTATATVHNINFMGKNWQDKIKLQDLPPTFFSEVLYDIDRLIEAQ